MVNLTRKKAVCILHIALCQVDVIDERYGLLYNAAFVSI